MLSEINQVQEDKGYMFSIMYGRETQSQMQALSHINIYADHVSKSGTIRGD
jgi:RecA/RadA recombinase